MTTTLTRRTLAPADAYVVLNRRTAAVELICGEQADYILGAIYDDHQVQPVRGGAYVVTRPYPVRVGLAHEVLQYMPLHGDQNLHRHIGKDALYAPKLSLDGRVYRDMPRVSGKELLQFIARHEGRFHRTLDDYILRTHRVGRSGPSRILGMWKPAQDA